MDPPGIYPIIAPVRLSPRGKSPRRHSLKLARIYRECTYSQNIRFVYQKTLELLEQGRMECLGNDGVSSLNARKCVAGNYDVKAENARRRYEYCDVTITGGYVRERYVFSQADQAMALLMICNGRSRFDSNDRSNKMPHKSLNLRSYVSKLQ